MMMTAIMILSTLCCNDADVYIGRGKHNRTILFNKYLSAIKETQIISDAGLKNLKTTWQKELGRSLKRFLNAKTFDDTYCAILSLQRSYHDMHSVLGGISYNSKNKTRLPFNLRLEFNNNNYEYVVINSSNSKIKIGYILKYMDNKSIADIEYDFMEWYFGNSLEQLKMELATEISYPSIPCFINRKPKEISSLIFYDPATNIEHYIDAEWLEESRVYVQEVNEYKSFSKEFVGLNYEIYSTDKNDTKIVNYYSFSYNFNYFDLIYKLSTISYKIRRLDQSTQFSENSLMIKDEKELIKYLKNNKVKNIIFDVRNNYGGDLPRYLLMNISKNDFETAISKIFYRPLFRKRPGSIKNITDIDYKTIAIDFFDKNWEVSESPTYPFFCQTKECKIFESKYSTMNKNNKFNIIVLSGPECMSACDDFIHVIKDNKIGKIVGLKSDGSTSPTRYTYRMNLLDGTEFYITMTVAASLSPITGENLEGKPAEVDFPFYPSVNNRNEYLRNLIKNLRKFKLLH